MLTNKKFQELLALTKTNTPLPEGASEEEKDFHEDAKRDYLWMTIDSKKRGIKNPSLEILFDID